MILFANVNITYFKYYGKTLHNLLLTSNFFIAFTYFKLLYKKKKSELSKYKTI